MIPNAPREEAAYQFRETKDCWSLFGVLIPHGRRITDQDLADLRREFARWMEQHDRELAERVRSER